MTAAEQAATVREKFKALVNQVADQRGQTCQCDRNYYPCFYCTLKKSYNAALDALVARCEQAERQATELGRKLDHADSARMAAKERAVAAEADATQLRRLLVELRASLKNALEVANEIGAGGDSRSLSPVAPDGPE